MVCATKGKIRLHCFKKKSVVTMIVNLNLSFPNDCKTVIINSFNEQRAFMNNVSIFCDRARALSLTPRERSRDTEGGVPSSVAGSFGENERVGCCCNFFWRRLWRVFGSFENFLDFMHVRWGHGQFSLLFFFKKRVSEF